MPSRPMAVESGTASGAGGVGGAGGAAMALLRGSVAMLPEWLKLMIASCVGGTFHAQANGIEAEGRKFCQ